jgi:hypothetical protein
VIGFRDVFARVRDKAQGRLKMWSALILLGIVPALVILVSLVGLLQTDAAVIRGGIQVKVREPLVAGEATIDPNFGTTSHALGSRAALDVVAGRLPLWNPHEGFGAPLLGETQSAALFPFTWLMAFRHGQTVEQALLQFLGGIGAYLFFRRFGIGGKASIAGAIVFEVNGVFAWLRNAIFNPVAFLPWLFFSVESAAVLAAEAAPLRGRALNICCGATMSALAVYAGFPEEVYLYSLLVAVWTAYRFFGLRGLARVTFLGDLCAIAILGLGLSAPILVCFAAYLPEAALGAHTEDGFVGAFLPPTAALQHILPYVFGSIFNPLSSAEVIDIWGNIGGYVGAAPFILGIAALFVPGHRGPKILLAGWIVVCVAVTFGVQPIYDAFMMLPLTGMTACYRIITVSMIFSFIFLAVLFIDAIDKSVERSHRRRMALGIAISIGLSGGAAVVALPVVQEGSVKPLGYVLASVAMGVLVLLAICFALLSRTRRSATILVGAFVAEAIALFAIPYLSYPRRGDIDRPLISFLTRNAGYSRVLATESAGIAPNYGSYFGVSTINYDDLPSPARTASYIHANLDPYANALIFHPGPVGITPEEQVARGKALPSALPAYARAGVKFLMVGAGFGIVPAAETAPGAAPQVSTGGYGDRRVHQDKIATVIELPDVRDYLTAGSCKLDVNSRDELTADCPEPSQLIRLELFMEGWEASVNGVAKPIDAVEDAFQGVGLPAGISHVRFLYWPKYLGASLAAAAASLALVLIGFAISVRAAISASRESSPA